MTTETPTAPATPYDTLGGEAGVQRLVKRFYELMDTQPEACQVRQMHPESLQGSATSLFEFLSGWFGGPSLYIAKKGHPRLRMRHAPYPLGTTVRDEWMWCMTQALNEQVDDPVFRARLLDNFDQMATHMINVDERPPH